MTEIDKITTLPDITAVQTNPSVRKIRLPELKRDQPFVYIPISINISKPGGLWLGIIFVLSMLACTAGNVAVLLFKQIITIVMK